MALEWQIERG